MKICNHHSLLTKLPSRVAQSEPTNPHIGAFLQLLSQKNTLLIGFIRLKLRVFCKQKTFFDQAYFMQHRGRFPQTH
jgi:hypothetical protein